MKEIKLTQGFVALVDDNDFDYLSQFKWHTKIIKNSQLKYAARGYMYRDEHGRKRTKILKMHRIILDVLNNRSLKVDHKDGDGLNNQRSNLRLCTHSENIRNSKRRRDAASKFRGVHLLKAAIDVPNRKKWRAKIRVDGKCILLGDFHTEIEAAISYNKGAIIYHGEFAHLNAIPCAA